MENLSNIEIGLRLLAVGMITVFVILSIVVLAAKLLIYFTNKLDISTTPVAQKKTKNGSISNKKLAILTSVVSHVTAGKGKIKEIRKL